MTGGALDANGQRGYNLRTMSHDRRTFLKALTLGGVALFTDDWFQLVAETKEATQGKQLPVHPAAVYGKGGQELNAFWSGREGYALYLNGTPYDEPPTRTYRLKLEADGDDHVIEALEQLGLGKYTALDDVERLDEKAEGGKDGETWREFIGRKSPSLLETLEYIESEGLPTGSWMLDEDIDSERDEAFVTDWCRRNAPEAAASVFLSGLIQGLRSDREEIRLADAIEAEGLRFVDGACPGNDTLVCAYANDYDTLAALQRILGARGHNCRVIILQANPADIAPAGD